jgi:hypothetical protein
VAIDEAVFLRPPLPGDGRVGDATESFGVDAFRESHENGLVNFLVGGGAGAGRVDDECDGGGGDHGTDGRIPEKPCSDGFEVLGGGAGFESCRRNY